MNASPRPKILYAFCSQNYSGAEIVLFRLIQALRDRVDPCVLCPPGEFSNLLKNSGVEVCETGALASLQRQQRPRSRFSLLLKLLANFWIANFLAFQLIRRKKIDIVHANNLAASFYLLPLLILSRLFIRRVVWIWSNHDLFYPQKKDFRFARLCHYFYAQTLAVSHAVQQRYPQYQDKISVLYNGLDVEKFKFSPEARLQARRQMDIAENAIVVGILGMISPYKGQHLLLNAFTALAQRHPHLKLMIVGRFDPQDPDYEKNIRQCLSALPPSQWILLPHSAEVVELYCALDILVNATLSQRSEPLGTTIYEAMACERIAVASDTGGTREIIEDGMDGFLFEANDPQALMRQLLFCIDNLNELDAMRRNAREKVVEKFNVEVMVQNYWDLILRLTEHQKGI